MQRGAVGRVPHVHLDVLGAGRLRRMLERVGDLRLELVERDVIRDVASP